MGKEDCWLKSVAGESFRSLEAESVREEQREVREAKSFGRFDQHNKVGSRARLLRAKCGIPARAGCCCCLATSDRGATLLPV